jgi:glyoxylase-like metal-dependent hydrolase (beta-lactamase superfamily II)
VDRILLTHRHLDHAGSADSLRRRCQAEVVIHTADAAAVEGRQRLSPARGALGLLVEPLIAVLDHRVFGYRPCQVTPVEDGWREHGLQLIHLPGHTPGNSGYLHAASGVVFCGDAAINTSAGPKHPSKLFSLDPVQVRRSQLVLADLDAEIYCFGHGPPLPRGAAALRRLATER